MKRIEQEQVLRVIEELKGNILIVEGRKDESAIRMLGLGPNQVHIVRVNSRPVAKVAQDIASLAEKHKNRGIIVLTDFDRTGRKMAARIRLLLQSRKIHANSRIRRDVMNLGIQRIEEMASVLGAGTVSEARGRADVRKPSVSRKSKFRERDDYGETGANFYEIRGKGLHKGKRDNRKAGRDRGDIRAD